MAYELAVFPSVHLVNRMKRRLNRDGRYFGMIRAPHGISPGGCGFALRFEESERSLVKETAAELGIAIEGIYKEETQENGSKVYTPIE
jgi:hypothetical protein